MAFDFITAGIELVKTVVAKFPDPAQRAAAQLEVAKLEQTGMLAQLAAETDLAKGQLAINAAEAASPSLFVSGWRPFIGWVCGAAFAYKFTLQPFLIFAMVASGSTIDWETLPVLDWTEMAPILLGLLGLGTMKTVEKVKGVN